MDLQTIITVIAGFLAAGAITMLFRTQASTARDIVRLRAENSNLREMLPQTYVTKADYKDDIREVKDTLKDILDELKHKADRHE